MNPRLQSLLRRHVSLEQYVNQKRGDWLIAGASCPHLLLYNSSEKNRQPHGLTDIFPELEVFAIWIGIEHFVLDEDFDPDSDFDPVFFFKFLHRSKWQLFRLQRIEPDSSRNTLEPGFPWRTGLDPFWRVGVGSF